MFRIVTRSYIDRSMGSELSRIDYYLGADLMDFSGELMDRVDITRNIGSTGHGNELNPTSILIQFFIEVFVIYCPILVEFNMDNITDLTPGKLI